MVLAAATTTSSPGKPTICAGAGGEIQKWLVMVHVC